MGLFISKRIVWLLNQKVPNNTVEVPHQFSTYPLAASTAWLVIAIENLLEPQDRALFWSYE